MESNEMVDHLKAGGFKDSADLIHVFQGGSYQHGASIPGKVSDIDLFGVYIEPPSRALGVTAESHFTGSTQDQYERNRPNDEDYKCYTLQRWASLACGGNPTILGFLYTTCGLPGVWTDLIYRNQHLFKARSHAKAFLGYAKGQVKRLDGTAGKGKHGQRPELESEFGYDTKAAMHLMRLLYEAEEYMLWETITYPRPEKHILLEIRQGAWSWEKLFKEYSEQEAKVEEAMKLSNLPDHVDRKAVSELITKAYLRHWHSRGLIQQYLEQSESFNTYRFGGLY